MAVFVTQLPLFTLAPSAPRNLTAVSITTNSFVVEWIAPAAPNGPVTTYNVEIRVGESVLKAENTSQRMLIVTGLDPVVKHMINICAYTIACGNVSMLAVQTNGGVCSHAIILAY